LSSVITVKIPEQLSILFKGSVEMGDVEDMEGEAGTLRKTNDKFPIPHAPILLTLCIFNS